VRNFRYLKPAADGWSWQLDGRCRQEDPRIFFTCEGERGTDARRRESRAKAVCAECPVAQQCRDFSLAIGEPFGVWGGLSENERVMLLNPGRRARGDRNVATPIT
jgi:WhiB family redox-sensing transcriptional regulator